MALDTQDKREIEKIVKKEIKDFLASSHSKSKFGNLNFII